MSTGPPELQNRWKLPKNLGKREAGEGPIGGMVNEEPSLRPHGRDVLVTAAAPFMLPYTRLTGVVALGIFLKFPVSHRGVP